MPIVIGLQISSDETFSFLTRRTFVARRTFLSPATVRKHHPIPSSEFACVELPPKIYAPGPPESLCALLAITIPRSHLQLYSDLHAQREWTCISLCPLRFLRVLCVLAFQTLQFNKPLRRALLIPQLLNFLLPRPSGSTFMYYNQNLPVLTLTLCFMSAQPASLRALIHHNN